MGLGSVWVKARPVGGLEKTLWEIGSEPTKRRWLRTAHSNLLLCLPQSKPLIPLQKEEDPETHKTVLTNYMFPQQIRTEDCEYCVFDDTLFHILSGRASSCKCPDLFSPIGSQRQGLILQICQCVPLILYFDVKFSGATIFSVAGLLGDPQGFLRSYFMKDLVTRDQSCGRNTSRCLLVKHLLVWFGFSLHQTACTDPVAS